MFCFGACLCLQNISPVYVRFFCHIRFVRDLLCHNLMRYYVAGCLVVFVSVGPLQPSGSFCCCRLPCALVRTPTVCLHDVASFLKVVISLCHSSTSDELFAFCLFSFDVCCYRSLGFLLRFNFFFTSLLDSVESVCNCSMMVLFDMFCWSLSCMCLCASFWCCRLSLRVVHHTTSWLRHVFVCVNGCRFRLAIGFFLS